MTDSQHNTVVPYGAWPSPLSSAMVAEGSARLAGLRLHHNGVCWIEQSPDGRLAIIGVDGSGESVEVLPAPYSARSAVHEYGGGAWWPGDSCVYFANWDDQRLYRLGVSGKAMAITPEPPSPRAWRYADGIEWGAGAWVICVRERHEPDGVVVNELVAVDCHPSPGTEPQDPIVLIDGGPDGFVGAPRLSPDSTKLSWLSWSHPNMPWDGTELWVADIDPSMKLDRSLKVAGGTQESIHGPDWTSNGQLVFSTDRSGWWNLHRWDPLAARESAVTMLVGSEIGQPMWVFDTVRWQELADGRLVAAVTTSAVDSLAVIEPSGAITPIETDLVEIAELAVNGSMVYVIGATSRQGASVFGFGLDSAPVSEIRVDKPLIDPAWFSEAQAVEITRPPNDDGDDTGVIHAFVYLPSGPSIGGPQGDKPPLIVIGHGGPTAHASPALNFKIQYWTSRGFVVADVNYGGSTGFGRAYRQLLNKSWGVIDVGDCVAVARDLVTQSMVDPNKIAIRGSSSGGLTVLGALASSSVFSAGTSLYGVTDLEALASDTHKFESRYLDSLIGHYPDQRSVYQERSPINHTDKLNCPVLVMQGLDDEIVPPSQAEAITKALESKGIPHAYVTFPGEQHGFRQKANVSRSLDIELWFYGQVFGFQPADHIEPPDGSVGLSEKD